MQNKKKKVSRVVVVTYTRTRGSDVHFKMRDARTDIQCRHTHRHCCFCLDIHRILNLLLEAQHLWSVHFAAWPVGNLGIWLVLGLHHSLSWQPPVKTQTEALPWLSPLQTWGKYTLIVCTDLFDHACLHLHACVLPLTSISVYVRHTHIFFTCWGGGLFGQKVVFKPSSRLLLQ